MKYTVQIQTSVLIEAATPAEAAAQAEALAREDLTNCNAMGEVYEGGDSEQLVWNWYI